MSANPRLPETWIWAVVGALVAAAGLIVPQWWFGVAGRSMAQDVPLITVAVVSLCAQAGRTGVTFRHRLVIVLSVAIVQAVCVALAAYWLYAVGRPDLLSQQAVQLQSQWATKGGVSLQQWLNPAAQAVNAAVQLVFWGVLFGGFAAFRARIRDRLRRP